MGYNWKLIYRCNKNTSFEKLGFNSESISAFHQHAESWHSERKNHILNIQYSFIGKSELSEELFCVFICSGTLDEVLTVSNSIDGFNVVKLFPENVRKNIYNDDGSLKDNFDLKEADGNYTIGNSPSGEYKISPILPADLKLLATHMLDFIKTNKREVKYQHLSLFKYPSALIEYELEELILFCDFGIENGFCVYVDFERYFGNDTQEYINLLPNIFRK